MAVSGTSPLPVPFGRHALAVLGATMISATLFGVFVGLVVAAQRANLSAAAALAGLVWLGTFVIAGPATGLLFTLAWPLMRHAGAAGWPASMLLGGAGGFGTMWTNHAMAGRLARPGELVVASLLGVMAGCGYWWIAGETSATAIPTDRTPA